MWSEGVLGRSKKVCLKELLFEDLDSVHPEKEEQSTLETPWEGFATRLTLSIVAIAVSVYLAEYYHYYYYSCY